VRTALLGLPLALALALVVAVGGCSGEQAAPEPAVVGSAASPPPDPETGRPHAGVCRQLRAVEPGAISSELAEVDCDSAHTAYTYYVGRFEPDVEHVDHDLAGRTCRKQMVATLRVRPARLEGTVLANIWFRPSKELWDDGARWFRCDLVAADFTGDRLLPLPAGTPAYRPRLPDEVARCIRQVGAGGSRFVTCSRPHDYRWAGSAEAGVGRRPGEDRARSIAEQRCMRFVGEGRFWFTWPTPGAWARGDRTVNCYRAGRG